MDEKQLGKMLLEHGDAKAMRDPMLVARQIVDSDRARLKTFADWVFTLWLIAVFGGGYATHYFIEEVLGDVVRNVRSGIEEIVAVNNLKVDPEKIWEIQRGYDRDLDDSFLVILGVTVAFLLAAGVTLGYVNSSRRATLRQINANLMDISEQLRQLQRTGEERAGPSNG